MAVNDIYQRNVNTLGGVFTADHAVLSLGDVSASLIQSTSVTYAQTVNRIYEVTSPAIYYIGGRTQGNAQINHIVGPKTIMGPFYQKFGNVCNARNNTLNLRLDAIDCDSGADTPTSMAARLAVITNLTIGVEASSMIINSAATLMFSSLTYSGPTT